MEQDIKKVVLAYSGGLDTSVIIAWLKENYNCEVVAVVGNVGQKENFEALEEKAINSGASKIYVEDLIDDYVDNYIFPTMKAGAKYEGVYLLGTSTARPVIAKRLVEIALEEGADAIAHGCTGKGNDQVRFELAIKHFAPNMKIIAPWRIWNIKSRQEELEYAKKHSIPLPVTEETNYSKDENIWHLSHEGMELEYPNTEPDYDRILELGVTPQEAPDRETYIDIEFDSGIPIALNGISMKGSDILRNLNKIGGENGIGIDDIVENRLVGMKSRGVYENAGGAILYKAHKIMESLTLDRDTMHFKEYVAIKFAELVYNGLWFGNLRKSLSAFVEETQKNVTGIVRLKLYKGNIINAGVKSPYTLYNEEFATFGEDGVYNQKDAEGFINLFGLPTKVQALMEEKLREQL